MSKLILVSVLHIGLLLFKGVAEEIMMEAIAYGINKGSSRIFCSRFFPPCCHLYKQTHTDSRALALARGQPAAAGLITVLRWPKSLKQEVLTSFEEEANRTCSKSAETVQMDILKASPTTPELVSSVH